MEKIKSLKIPEEDLKKWRDKKTTKSWKEHYLLCCKEEKGITISDFPRDILDAIFKDPDLRLNALYATNHSKREDLEIWKYYIKKGYIGHCSLSQIISFFIQEDIDEIKVHTFLCNDDTYLLIKKVLKEKEESKKEQEIIIRGKRIRRKIYY